MKERAITIMVKRKLGKVGGSLILRIPKEVEESLNLKSGKDVRILVEKGR